MSACNNYGHFSLPNTSSVYDALQRFTNTYGRYHAYVALGICVPGILMNLLNVAVLTRQSMRSAVNAVLAVIAVSDGLVMTSYILYTYHFRIKPWECSPQFFSRFWAYFTVVHGHLTVVLHTSAMWLSIYLACTRYVTIRNAKNHKGTRSPPTIRNSMFASSVITITVMSCYLPAYLTFEVKQWPREAYSNFALCNLTAGHPDASASVYVTSMTELANKKDCLLVRALFWSTGLFAKLIPCLLLVVVIVLLVLTISDVRKRRSRLQRQNTGDQKCATADRTTVMLTVVIIVVFLTEFPQGLLSVGVSLFGRHFYTYIYQSMGDFMDVLSLINSSVNFIIYCTMSKAFRTEFAYVIMFWRSKPTYWSLLRANGRMTRR